MEAAEAEEAAAQAAKATGEMTGSDSDSGSPSTRRINLRKVAAGLLQEAEVKKGEADAKVKNCNSCKTSMADTSLIC